MLFSAPTITSQPAIAKPNVKIGEIIKIIVLTNTFSPSVIWRFMKIKKAIAKSNGKSIPTNKLTNSKR
jgi:hypothetical protein